MNITILSNDGKHKGHYTGGIRKCQMEGCNGKRHGVRWEDKKLTFPCSKGIREISETLHQII